MHWIRSKDPDLLVVKRSVRAAVVIPSVFAIAHAAFSDPQVGLFGAFGSFALLLLAEFTGRPRTRIASYGGLSVVGACFTVLGTVVSTNKVAAVVAMALVGFAVLFTGIVAPQAATASTAALLTFVLPVAVAQPASEVGPRLVGWALAGAFCIPACMLVWPPPWHDNLRRRLAGAVSAVARLGRRSRPWRRRHPRRTADVAPNWRACAAVLRHALPPDGRRVRRGGAVQVGGSGGMGRRQHCDDPGRALVDGAATGKGGHREGGRDIATDAPRSSATATVTLSRPAARIEAVQESTRRLDQLIGAETRGRREHSERIGDDAHEASVPLPNAPRARAWLTRSTPASTPGLSALRRRWWRMPHCEAAGARRCDRPSPGDGGRIRFPRPRHRLLSHLSFRSVWFRNAVRGAVGLAIVVTVIEVTDVSHGFWVVLGTLSVLRSNALGTGATALRAVGGTALGFVAGSIIMIGVADHLVLLWVLLPVAVLVCGIAPSMISFAAGQAAFTLLVIILFNIIQPIGWKVGLTRISRTWPSVAGSASSSGSCSGPVVRQPHSDRALRRVRGQFRLPGRRGRAADHDESAGEYRSQPASLTPGLPSSRRRLPPVLRRTRSQGGVGGDHLPALHWIEPAAAGGLHPGHAPRPPSRGRATRGRVRGRRRSGPARLLRGQSPLVRGVRRPTRRPARRAGRAAAAPAKSSRTSCGRRWRTSTTRSASTGRRRPCRCCGPMNCSTTRARCKMNFRPRPTASSAEGAGSI